MTIANDMNNYDHELWWNIYGRLKWDNKRKHNIKADVKVVEMKGVISWNKQ